MRGKSSKRKGKSFSPRRKLKRGRIINERTAEAEEILSEIEEIFARDSISEADLIKARTLKNRLGDKAYDNEREEFSRPQYIPAKIEKLKAGDKVFVKNINQEGVVQSVRPQKNEAEVLCGNIRVRSKISDLSVLISERNAQNDKKKPAGKRVSDRVQVSKNLTPKPLPSLELNVIGMTVQGSSARGGGIYRRARCAPTSRKCASCTAWGRESFARGYRTI